jgi:hypothetical protein
MRERISLYGGTLETGRREQVGFRVFEAFAIPGRPVTAKR